jgi:hypothetical protein
METQTKTRPASITVISWILIIGGALAIFGATSRFNRPEAREHMNTMPIPITLQMARTYIGHAITILCGVTMLKGKNWARLFLTIWYSLGFLLGFIVSPHKLLLLPSFLLFLLLSYFLFRPASNLYFAKTPPGDNPPPIIPPLLPGEK